MDENGSTLAAADIAINQDIFNLVVIEYEGRPDITPETKRQELEDAFKAQASYDCDADPGFTVPDTNIPGPCTEAATVLQSIQKLKSDTKEALCFQ